MLAAPEKHHSPSKASSAEAIIRAWLGSLLGMGFIAWLASLNFNGIDYLLIVGSFGASSVLLFAAPGSPFAQPRNLFGGHALSALIGVACYLLLHEYSILAPAMAVASAIAAMQLSRTLHPPGGATALIAVIGEGPVHQIGFGYVASILIGAGVLFISAFLTQNLFSKVRRYPEFWW